MFNGLTSFEGIYIELPPIKHAIINKNMLHVSIDVLFVLGFVLKKVVSYMYVCV